MGLLTFLLAILFLAFLFLLVDLLLALFVKDKWYDYEPIFGITKRIVAPKYDIKLQNKFLNESLWIKKVIDSCETYEQCGLPISNLIDNFETLYKGKVERELFRSVSDDLFNYKMRKRDRL